MKALGFLAGDPERLERFLGLTGWTPLSLKQPAATQALLASALEHLAGDESLLLTFAANAGLDPARVVEAAHRLASGEGTSGGDGGGDAGDGNGS